jgi:formylglycine-generating enzyme required for sulfatase activity
MNTFIPVLRPLALTLLVMTNITAITLAQEVSIPDPGLNAAIREVLEIPVGPLTEPDLLGLTGLIADTRNITRIDGLGAARNLTFLDLDSNRLTNFALPNTLTNLTLLDVSFNLLAQCILPTGLKKLDQLFLERNGLTNMTLPAGLTALTEVEIWANGLTSFAVPADMTNVTFLSLSFNQLTNVTLPNNLTKLGTLDLDANKFASLKFPTGLRRLSFLGLRDNRLTGLAFPEDMTNLNFVDIGNNQLADLKMPSPLPHLNFLRLITNKLTSIVLPPGMTNLEVVFLAGNQLTNLTLASGMSNLVQLDLRGNQLTSLTLPPDLFGLSALLLDGNPLQTLVLSETQAATKLAGLVATLRGRGVSVITYPANIQLSSPRCTVTGAFEFMLTGPPGNYAVLGSTNFETWSVVGVASNPLGSVIFRDVTTNAPPQKFYRVQLQVSPANMVLIPPNTFTMGSPDGEVGHQVDEGPQTMVTLSRGFWIGKYEVTQGEYLAVTGENPSGFPGDLNRPVESVSFFAASNYCFLLTAQELASGRIPPGSHYRLPTEAEWECAARAGTSTRFSHGDDPDLTGLSNFAWFGAHNGITTHPVGQKLPNAWGLYDMAGNVWEWCQDWYGTYPGGAVTDPQGPSTNPIEWKVIRGGAWEASEFDCRSASRWFEGASPFISDFIIGFRVVLVSEP